MPDSGPRQPGSEAVWGEEEAGGRAGEKSSHHPITQLLKIFKIILKRSPSFFSFFFQVHCQLKDFLKVSFLNQSNFYTKSSNFYIL